MGRFEDVTVTEYALSIGDTFYAVYEDGTRILGVLTEISDDGDVDDEGCAYGWNEGAGLLASGLRVWIDDRSDAGIVYHVNYGWGNTSAADTVEIVGAVD